jgi:hypothetical protein
MKMSSTKTGACLALLGGLGVSAGSQAAGTIDLGDGRSVSIAGGLRAGFETREDAAPNGTDDSTDFNLQSARLYLSGSASDIVKFTLNTECLSCSSDADIFVLDAIAQLELSKTFNVWIGRMLTPADRIEMNGPYYGLNWNQYTVPLLPSDQDGTAGIYGRDEGVTVWGASGKLQYAIGLFEGVDGAPNVEDNLLIAARVAYNFLNMESNPGYYTSSTYYGGLGDIFTVALSFQTQSDAVGTAALPSDFTGTIVDVLYENALDGGAALTIEGELKMFDADVAPAAIPSCDFCLFDGDSFFVTAAYLLPGDGTVRWQPYIRFNSNEPDGGLADSDLTELGLNMILKGHNARMNVSWASGDANISGFAGPDVDTLSFGIQVQI